MVSKRISVAEYLSDIAVAGLGFLIWGTFLLQ
jgi:hypothetical protein